MLSYDRIDSQFYKTINIFLVCLLILLFLAHIIPPTIEVLEEFSFGHDKGNLPSTLLMAMIAMIAGALAYRLHYRKQYFFSYATSWLIPIMFIVMLTDIRSTLHDIAALTLISLAYITTTIFFFQSRYSWVGKIKILLIFLFFPLGFFSFGLLQKVLVVESCISFYIMNQWCLALQLPSAPSMPHQ